MDGGGAQRPVWGGKELKKTGARTRGQNPLVAMKEFVKPSPEFLAGSVEFPPLPVHLDTRATENVSVVFFLSCVSRITRYF
jgi:hypothetical protein